MFSVISKILSHSEDSAYEEGMLGALHESFHSYLNKVRITDCFLHIYGYIILNKIYCFVRARV